MGALRIKCSYLANDPYQSKNPRLRNANAFTLGAKSPRRQSGVVRPATPPMKNQTLIAAGADIVDLERALPSLGANIWCAGGDGWPCHRSSMPAAPTGRAMPSGIRSRRQSFRIWRPRNALTASKKASGFPLRPGLPETVRVRVREAKEAIRNGASIRGPVRDVSGPSLRIGKGASRMTQPCAAWTESPRAESSSVAPDGL